MNDIITNRIITADVVAIMMVVELKDDCSLGKWARIRLIKLIMFTFNTDMYYCYRKTLSEYERLISYYL